jgi:hypothetical protein
MPGRAPSLVISHWYHLLENFNASPLEFYLAVEAALAKRQVPEASTSRVDYREGGVQTAKREYLRVTRRKLVFDICGAPFGTGFFVSWWLGQARPSLYALWLFLTIIVALIALNLFISTFGFFWGVVLFCVAVPAVLWILNTLAQQGEFSDDVILMIPLVGPLYERLFQPTTYYKIDTMLMFQTAVHAAVLEVIDGMTSAKGVRALSELERKPILRDFAQR